MPVWVDGKHSMIPLPDGLVRFQRLTFKEIDPAFPVHAVLVDDAGREYHLAHNQYEGACEIEVGDKWLLESDPRAQDTIRDFIERLKMEPAADYSLQSNAAVIEIWEAVLRRGGV